ncbi:MAG: TetR/AcrR family transcriptional regulator [Cyanobacteria bacterium J06621_11]
MVSKSSATTQAQILDAAEQLFATQGLHATSLRSIVKAAGVNLAAIHYHFGSKEGLILAALKRAIKPIVSTQIKRLIAVEAREMSPSVETVFRAFFAPVLEVISLKQNGRGLIQVRFIGRCCTEPTMEEFVAEEFHLSQKLFIQAFRQVLPDCSRSEIEWKLDFAIAILVRQLCAAFQSKITFQAPSPDKIEVAIQRLVKFAAAGIRA